MSTADYVLCESLKFTPTTWLITEMFISKWTFYVAQQTSSWVYFPKHYLIFFRLIDKRSLLQYEANFINLKIFFKHFTQVFGGYTRVKACLATYEAHFDITLTVIDHVVFW